MHTDLHRPTSRVLDILELLSNTPTGLTPAEIARTLGMPKSTLSPIIHTLEERHFIAADQTTGTYHIGVNAFFTGCRYKSEHPVLDYIRIRMAHITEQSGETCHLGILSDGQILYIAKTDSPNPVALRSIVGRMLPAYCTGLGKALLMQCNEEQLHKIYPDGLEKHTPATITKFPVLAKELEKVRRDGFAYEHAELTEGIVCIAVPLCISSNPAPVAALSISLPAYRLNQEVLDKLKDLLRSERKNIEYHLELAGINDKSQFLSDDLI